MLGLQIVAEFADVGVSGTTGLYDRPGLTRLVEYVAGNGARTVLVEKADRLARDLVQHELILRELHQAGITVIEAEAGTNLTEADNPTRRFVRQILAAASELDKSSLVAKLRAARDRKREQTGRCGGPPPYGELPGEAEIVALIRRLRRRNPRTGRRRSTAEIASELDKFGHKPRRGGRWSRGTVRAILKRLGK